VMERFIEHGGVQILLREGAVVEFSLIKFENGFVKEFMVLDPSKDRCLRQEPMWDRSRPSQGHPVYLD
jgi:hypothetical protein